MVAPMWTSSPGMHPDIRANGRQGRERIGGVYKDLDPQGTSTRPTGCKAISSTLGPNQDGGKVDPRTIARTSKQRGSKEAAQHPS